MSQDNQLSELQMAVMRILWNGGEATAAQVHELMQKDRALAFTTVATVLSRLEKRGLVSHRTEGRKYIYRPEVAEKDVRRSMVTDIVDRLFKGDASALVNHLLTENEIDADDLEKVKAFIEAAGKKEENNDVA